jgi:hypothetical protein
MEDRWDCQRVVCIKEYKTIKVGSHYDIKGRGNHYDIKGRGNLTWNADPEVEGKKGYGFCIEDQLYGSFSGRKDWWNLPHNEKIKWYYFTEKEVSEYFINEDEDYKSHLRNEKLISLGL